MSRVLKTLQRGDRFLNVLFMGVEEFVISEHATEAQARAHMDIARGLAPTIQPGDVIDGAMTDEQGTVYIYAPGHVHDLEEEFFSRGGVH